MTELSHERLVLGFVILTALVLVYLLRGTPQLVRERGGHALLFLGAFVLVLAACAAGFSKNMESATTTSFCLSCHEMEAYGKSLHIDDTEPLPAVHFQNRLIPTNHACYTCHTDYGMFGNAKAKLNGLRHMYVHFLSNVPEKITLYKPFLNRNCLHCHDGMRRFEESKHHQTAESPLARIRSGEVSCLAAGCHDAGHLVHDLADQEFWSPKGGEEAGQ